MMKTINKCMCVSTIYYKIRW